MTMAEKTEDIKRPLLVWMALVALLAGACGVSDSAAANTLAESRTFGGVAVNYRVVLPDDYDPARTYPAILAFTGGGQTERNVEAHLDRFWKAEAERRGYIVVSPAAPREGLFFQGGDRIFPEFLDAILGEYNIEDGKFHAAGASNGGLSAFHVAALYPGYFKSVTGLPGYLPQASTAGIEAMRPLCIYMHVGERDTFWLRSMEDQAQQFERNGLSVHFQVEAEQEHFIRTLSGPGAVRLFDQIESVGDGCG
jgi:poly(3-hydroxybutyrate) depolymerase